jgi:imidazolonepropionase-like amidohydrolase
VSVGVLNLLAEARTAGEIAGLDASAVLSLATLEAAHAIGWGAGIGALEPGRRGDVAVFASTGGDPCEGVLAAPPRALLTALEGRVVHR